MMIIIIDLGRAKSKALFNIYSFLKENIKSRKKRQGKINENSKKKTRDLIRKKATLHMQHTFFLVSKKTTFLVLHTFLYISLPLFTPYLNVLRRKCLYCALPVHSVFFTATHFHLGSH